MSSGQMSNSSFLSFFFCGSFFFPSPNSFFYNSFSQVCLDGSAAYDVLFEPSRNPCVLVKPSELTFSPIRSPRGLNRREVRTVQGYESFVVNFFPPDGRPRNHRNLLKTKRAVWEKKKAKHVGCAAATQISEFLSSPEAPAACLCHLTRNEKRIKAYLAAFLDRVNKL